MAHNTPLAAWLYSNRQALSPKFLELEWPGRYLPGIYDFAVTVELNGTSGEGRGLAESRELALEKASSEAIERLICRLLDLDSVGMAVSGSLDPRNHARNELYERHFLDLHLKMSISMTALVLPLGGANAVIDSFRNLNPDVNLSFFKFSTPPGYHGTVCLIDNQSKSLGFAFGTSLEDAKYRSFLEALPNYAWFQNKRDGRQMAPSPSALPWHIREEFLNNILPLLGNDSTDSAKIQIPQAIEVPVDIKHIPVFKDAPFRVARFVLVGKDERP